MTVRTYRLNMKLEFQNRFFVNDTTRAYNSVFKLLLYKYVFTFALNSYTVLKVCSL